jgi:chorismate-pyruvate lyase
MAYSVVPTSQWLDLEGLLKQCREEAVEVLVRLILTSDGTVTRLLEVLSLSPVNVELISHHTTLLSKAEAGFLEIEAGQPAIARNVWLCHRDQRLMYASSTLPTEGMNKILYNEIVDHKKSLGSLMGEYHYPALRDKMGFCWVQSPDIAKALGVTASERFWARRYRLRVEGILQAFIIEVFSPRLFTGFK